MTRPPWVEVWEPAPTEVRTGPPPVMLREPGGGCYACAGCPGADQEPCCRHREWRARRLGALRTDVATDPSVSGMRGRRRKWRLTYLFTTRARELETNR